MPSSIPISSSRKFVGTDFSKCIDFNQSNSAVNHTTPAILQDIVTDYSYFQYFNARTITSTARRLLDQGNQGLLVIITTNGVQVQARHASVNGLVVVPISYVTTGEWHSIVANWSNTMSYPEVYFDGQLFTSGTTNKSGARLAAGTPSYIGNRSALDRTFDGLLDKYALLSRTATQAEVLAFHQRGVLPSNALVSYEMNESSGSLTDASGNVVTGTVANVTQNVSSFSMPSRSVASGRAAAGTRVLV